jgi:hypothetical protein
MMLQGIGRAVGFRVWVAAAAVAAALDALDSKHIWDGMEAPMVGFGLKI